MTDPTPDEMERHVARFANLTPSTAYRDERLPGYGGRTTYTVIGDATDRAVPGAPPLAADAIRMNLVRCEPGGGAPLHAHPVQEVFMPLDGEWEITWGNGSGTLRLGPLDTIAVPPGVMRGFRNAGEKPAMLLAMVGGTDPGRTAFPDSIRALAAAHDVAL